MEAAKELGFEPFDWTVNPVKKPFSENPTRARTVATLMAHAVALADVVVTFYHPNLLGGHIETGIAIAEAMYHPETPKTVIIVGAPEETERSIYYFFSFVRRCRDAQEALAVLRELSL